MIFSVLKLVFNFYFISSDPDSIPSISNELSREKKQKTAYTRFHFPESGVRVSIYTIHPLVCSQYSDSSLFASFLHLLLVYGRIESLMAGIPTYMYIYTCVYVSGDAPKTVATLIFVRRVFPLRLAAARKNMRARRHPRILVCSCERLRERLLNIR